jgi:uncharacterized protein (TIGR02186 family)
LTLRDAYQKKVVWWLGLLLLLGLPRGASSASLELQVAPGLVGIGASFQGAQVTVSGQIPPGSQAVVEVLGENSVEELMRKGRRGGLWMNVGEIKVKGAPSLYLAMSTTPELLSSPQGEAAAFGYQALQKCLTFCGCLEEKESPRFFQEFLKLKESEGLYGTFPGALKIAATNPGGDEVQGTFRLPAKTAPGQYQVCLSVLSEGRLLGRKCVPLQVAMVGFPAALSDLAYQHGALYGILAVIIAIVTGFVMGFIFKGKAAH